MVTIAIDNETFLISRRTPLPKVVCTSVFHDEMEDAELLRGGEILSFMHNALSNEEVHFVGCNVAYDFGTLAATWPELLPAIFKAYSFRRIHDVALRQQLFDIALGRTFADDKVTTYSLNSLSKLILGERMEGKSQVVDEGWRLRYGELDGIPTAKWPEAAVRYAKTDARTTWRIWKEQEAAAHLMQNGAFQAAAAFALTLISARGMVTDAATVAQVEKHHRDIMERLAPELRRAGLLEGEVKKQKPAQERIKAACEAKGIEPPLTDSGQISTDRAACLVSGDELMLKRSEYVTAEKMLSTYIPFLRAGTTGPVTTRFHLAATGRTTSAAPSPPLEGGNLQNAPRKGGIRECFVPRPGYVLMGGDFSGAELHCLAQVLKDKLGHTTLGETLRSGRDVHTWLASHLIGVSYEECESRIAAGVPEAIKARQEAKAGNFGYPGGMGVRTFIRSQLVQAERVWSYEDAARLKQVWLSAFPEMDDYFRLMKHELGPAEEAQMVLTDGFLRTVKGFTTACNTNFQERAASGAKRAIFEVTRRCFTMATSPLYGCRPVNFIHDEMLLEVPDKPEKYRPALMEFQRVMAEEFNKVVKDFPTRVDAVLMRRWSKKASFVRDEKGQVLPWG